MKPLTIEYAIENKLSPTDCVKYFKPNWSEKECSHYLWENTCFPFSNEKMIESLNEQFLKSSTNE
jgi:hypothetical protein